MLILNNKEKITQKCEDVLPEEVDSLIKTLEAELVKINKLGNNGIGLAAPQIGIFKKAAIIRMEDVKLNLINCKIDKKYHEFIFQGEACLSFPGQFADTIRYKEVYITNNLVEPNEFIATDFLAIACQHEIDHFNETVLFDRQIKKIVKIKQKPNEICLCGKLDSLTNKGKKYKKCCGR